MLGDREVIHQLQALVAKLPFIILGAVCRFLTRITVILIVNWTGCLLAWSQITAQGAFQKNIAIALPNYYHVEPNLHLIYNSLAGNGWLGEGWSLVGSSEIFRASAGRGAPITMRLTVSFSMALNYCPAKGQRGIELAASPSCKYKEMPQQQAFAARIENSNESLSIPRRLVVVSGTSGRKMEPSERTLRVFDLALRSRCRSVGILRAFRTRPGTWCHLPTNKQLRAAAPAKSICRRSRTVR